MSDAADMCAAGRRRQGQPVQPDAAVPGGAAVGEHQLPEELDGHLSPARAASLGPVQARQRSAAGSPRSVEFKRAALGEHQRTGRPCEARARAGVVWPCPGLGPGLLSTACGTQHLRSRRCVRVWRSGLPHCWVHRGLWGCPVQGAPQVSDPARAARASVRQSRYPVRYCLRAFSRP